MARNLYEKLMTKYEANPEDPMAKFTKFRPKNTVKDPNSTIARVKEALSKGKPKSCMLIVFLSVF